MLKTYKDNKRFRDYVDKYRKAYGCTLEEALTHKIVHLYYLEVKDGEDADKKYHVHERKPIHIEIHQSV